MGYRKEKKHTQRKNNNRWADKFKAGWRSRLPVLLFVGGFALFMGLFYVVWLSSWFNAHINSKIASLNAFLSSKILNLFGQQTLYSGATVSSPVFSISVARGCDGIEAMAIFVSALLAFPMPWRKKIRGVLIGIACLFLLNLFRIISLFLTGVYYPSVFDTMHVEVWQALFILAALGLWAAWIFHASKIRHADKEKTV